MGENLFDEFVQSSLHNHASALPDDMFERIMQKRKRRPKAFYWKPFAGGLLLAGMVGSTLFLTTSNDSDIVKQPASNQHLQASALTNSTTIAPTPAVDNELNNTSKKNNIISIVREHINITQQPIRSLNKAGNSIPTKKSAPKHIIDQKIINQFLEQHTTANLSPDRVSISPIPAVVDFNGNNYTKAALAIRTPQIKSLTATPSKQLLNSRLPGIACPSAQGPRRKDLYVEVFTSPDYSFKKVASSTLSQQYLNSKDSTETMQLGFSAGIRISKSLGQHLMFKTGLQYSQINERFNYQLENEIRIITVISIRTIIRGPGDTLRITDTSYQQQIGRRIKRTNNQYRSLDIPVLLGYEFGKGGNLTIGITAGAIFNVQSWYNGDMLDTSYTPVAFNNKAGNSVYKRSVGVSVFGSLNFIYKISSRTDVFAEPYLRYSLNSITSTQSGFQQRFHTVGINLGIRYQIKSASKKYPGN
jgi:hypothetical protein